MEFPSSASNLKRCASAPYEMHDLGASHVDEFDPSHNKVVIGVCALDKKARSKPMKEILNRILSFGVFEVVIFGDDCILNEPIESWPKCDVLISFFSQEEGKTFPLKKAEAYAKLTGVFLLNDLEQQYVLLDRRKVYQILHENNIATPPHLVVSRDGPTGDDPDFEEEEDLVRKHGTVIYKPFVEKPVDGEDHNIMIYYPHSVGGGMKGLFRKRDDRSSEFHAGWNNVRRDGSFIYEAYLRTGGTDVKVYTVGPDYAHAEARKSPTVDGRVKRGADGKEVRYPVLLSPPEKEIARRVCLAFKQNVCGFDLLRCAKKSYVCDVNGWSFVKNSCKYYDDAAGVIRTIILSKVAPHKLQQLPQNQPRICRNSLSGSIMVDPFELSSYSPPDRKFWTRTGFAYVGTRPLLHSRSDHCGLHESARESEEDASPQVGEFSDEHTDGSNEELRCVLAVIRHGDRTPKQKIKVAVTAEPLIELLQKYGNGKGNQAKLKSPAQLQHLLDAVRIVLEKPQEHLGLDRSALSEDYDEASHNFRKLRQVRDVLEQGGQFSGINRKAQLKPLKWVVMDGVSFSEESSGSEVTYEHSKRKPQVRVTRALLIMKHGGVLTHQGGMQAEQAGSMFRTSFYPQYGPGDAGGGLLRLHSTYRHDLKIYSSDEGRVQMTAAAFVKGLLDLEGTSLAPILVSLVKKDASMLDAFGKGASEDISAAKHILYMLLNSNSPDGIYIPEPSPVLDPSSPPAPHTPGSPVKPSPGPSLTPCKRAIGAVGG
ncbi:hypothetical protein CYMTET_27718 [Cymbomonas tetramitiformis]|uniref:Inositol hexakisphosphate and diphosphoinositol-pentakisphosphate kinase n=1 Tax=Cymbomonas tetramitiformis TaxID=36881 RepID=A0AAE0FPS9_9CHLO|nr:hypothetical protein CYMTET_27718 [Cymbomonas tetramitiformis]